MIHTARAYCVSEVHSAEELAEKLTAHARTLCTAFRLGDYLFLNDSTHEDGGQEYAVLKRPSAPGEPYRQVESITFGSCDFDRGLAYVRRVLAGRFDRSGTAVRHQLYLETEAEHELCHHCA